jgi:hypothetical protein
MSTTYLGTHSGRPHFFQPHACTLLRVATLGCDRQQDPRLSCLWLPDSDRAAEIAQGIKKVVADREAGDLEGSKPEE